MKRLKQIAVAVLLALAALGTMVACGNTAEPPAVTVAPALGVSEVTYDKSTAGALDVPFTIGSGVLHGLMLDGVLTEDGTVTLTNGAASIAPSVLLGLSNGLHEATLVTDHGGYTFALCVDNFVYDRVDLDEAITYGGTAYIVDADLSQTAIKAIYVNGNVASTEDYAWDASSITLRPSLFDKLPGMSTMRIELANNNFYESRVFTDNLYASDYDLVMDWDPIQSDYGWNPLANDTNMISFVEGLDGTCLRYAPENGTYKMGDWANLFLTVKDPSYIGSGITWKSLDFINTPEALYEISFDYLYEDEGSDEFALYLLQDASDGYYSRPKTAGIAFPIERKSARSNFTLRMSGDALKGFYVHADRNSDGVLLVDNLRVTRLADVETPTTVQSSYDHTGKGSEAIELEATVADGNAIRHAVLAAGSMYARLDTDAVTVGDGRITLSADIAASLVNHAHLKLFFDNGEVKDVAVTSDLILYSDYDTVTLYDTTPSAWGANAFAQDSAMISLAEGFDGRAIRYEPGKATFAMGLWANRFLTVRNEAKYTFTWYPLVIDESKTYTVEFDYLVSADADCAFTLSLLHTGGDGAYITPWSCGTVYALDGEKGTRTHFSATVAGSEFYGMLIYAPDGYQGTASLLVDNLRITVGSQEVMA